MPFKLPSILEEERKKREQLERFTFVDGKEIHPSELPDRSVTPEQHDVLRMNSYASEALIPKLDTRVLTEKAMYYKSQCGREKYPNSTYNEAIIHSITPELVKRLQMYYDKYGEI